MIRTGTSAAAGAPTETVGMGREVNRCRMLSLKTPHREPAWSRFPPYPAFTSVNVALWRAFRSQWVVGVTGVRLDRPPPSYYQRECRPGDSEANIAKVLHGLDFARCERVDIMCFPESLLAGYFDTFVPACKAALLKEIGLVPPRPEAEGPVR